MTTPHCPTPETLERLADGALVDDDEELTRVEGHVERCPICQKTLHHLAVNGREVRDLQQLLEHGATVAESFLDRLVRAVPRSRAQDDRPAIEGYDVLEELGHGATSIVYRAHHRETDRHVALKVLTGTSRSSPETRRRFHVEARAIARLCHPNIAQIYDAGEHAGAPFLALELVQGFNLANWIGGNAPPARDVAAMAATLADAVQYAHDQGVVHRDLKPANILVSDTGGSALTLKITDFGLAKLITPGETEPAITLSGEVLGTPAYTAPEQAQGAPTDVGPAADIYSLGAILYEMLTGRPSFQGPTPLATLLQVVHDKPVPPSQIIHDVPRDLETICLTCLEKSPARRYATAGDLAADLRRFLRHERIQSRGAGPVRRAVRLARRGLAGIRRQRSRSLSPG
jgi:serine/threonine protein kinase